MVLPRTRRIQLPEVLKLPRVNWEGIYSNLVHNKFGRGEAEGPSQLRVWAIVAALLELYDYCRTLDDELRKLQERPAQALPDDVPSGDNGKLAEQIAALQKRVEELERGESQTAGRRIKVLNI